MEPKRNDIINGDAMQVMRGWKPCIDLTVTSPPYDDMRDYHGYEFDAGRMLEAIHGVTVDGGVCVWVVGDRIVKGSKTLTSFKCALKAAEIGWRVHDVMIYQKKNTPFMRSNAYTAAFEYMFVFSKGAPKTFNPLMVKTVRQGKATALFAKGADGKNKKREMEHKESKHRTNVWPYAVGRGGSSNDSVAFEHPAIFPEALAQDHILSWLNEGDLVLDPMAGSGTTLKMAKATGRDYIGVEISAEYAAIAAQRIEGVLI